jgi:hypothetical protein
VLLLAAVAPAGVLINDPNAYTDANRTWCGSQQFDNTEYLPDLSIRLEYCVYAPGNPGDPGTFAASFPGQDPTNGAKWIYAYQIFNNIAPHPGSSPDYVDRFSVGLNEGNELPSNIGYVVGTGQDPNASSLPSLTAAWFFTRKNGLSNKLLYPSTSAVLFYASPFGPELDGATVQGLNLKYLDDSVPSPTPEPTTLVLTVAALGLAIRRRKR